MSLFRVSVLTVLLVCTFFAVWFTTAHRVSILIEANTPNIQGLDRDYESVRVFYVSINVFYRGSDQKEAVETVFNGLIPANEIRSITLPAQLPWKFKRTEIRVLHPGYQPVHLSRDDNPHGVSAAELIRVESQAWPNTNEFRAVDGQMVTEFFDELIKDYMPLFDAESFNDQLYPHEAALINLPAKSVFPGLAKNERWSRLESVRMNQSIVMQHVHPPGYKYTPKPLHGDARLPDHQPVIKRRVEN